MKKTIIVLFLILACVKISAQETQTQLVVWAKNGTKVAYALTDMPKVTFTEKYMVIMANGVEVVYALENMARFTYETSSTGIINIRTGKTEFSFQGESLLFPSLKANNTVSVYSLSGTTVFKKIVSQDGEYSFPLSNLSAGVYLINVNGQTYKIIKK